MSPNRPPDSNEIVMRSPGEGYIAPSTIEHACWSLHKHSQLIEELRTGERRGNVSDMFAYKNRIYNSYAAGEIASDELIDAELKAVNRFMIPPPEGESRNFYNLGPIHWVSESRRRRQINGSSQIFIEAFVTYEVLDHVIIVQRDAISERPATLKEARILDKNAYNYTRVLAASFYGVVL